MRLTAALLSVLALALAGQALAVVSVAVVDGTSTLAEVAPASGSPAIRFSTADGIRFSNEGSTEPELIVLSATHSFVYDRDATTSTTSVTHQGATTQLADNLFVAQGASSVFLPLRIATAADLTSEATGWTKNAECGTVGFQGSLSIPWHANDGAAQASLTRYYQVCDAATEIYVDADKDLSAGADFAYASTQQGLVPGEAEYEVVIQGTDFVFASAASATTVTLQQGRHVASALTSGVTNVDAYFLYRFPDGFPAGATTTTLTATATDIMV